LSHLLDRLGPAQNFPGHREDLLTYRSDLIEMFAISSKDLDPQFMF
jgi:hypothetical protein